MSQNTSWSDPRPHLLQDMPIPFFMHFYSFCTGGKGVCSPSASELLSLLWLCETNGFPGQADDINLSYFLNREKMS